MAAPGKLRTGSTGGAARLAASVSSAVPPAGAAQAPSASDVPAATAATPSAVTVYLTVKVDNPLPAGTTAITNEVTSNEGACQEPEPVSTATNPTRAPGPPPTVPAPTVPAPRVNGAICASGGDQPHYPYTDSSHRLSFRCVYLRSTLDK